MGVEKLLTLPIPIADEERKLKLYFHTSLWCRKGFMKPLKAFMKPFEAPQRSVKIKMYVNLTQNVDCNDFELNQHIFSQTYIRTFCPNPQLILDHCSLFILEVF